ncbi:metal ABC transporter ATP-binding protein [Nocardioides mangrovicus]|uniref:metal ABC transporter ATP-binding protein n=1 Tax=Nocardioides mangrovicus TaxID=2478913 RepID=UPI0018E08FC1|nr:ABC transporter ATP-binding protein [Nocardioides mangrovicus]
MSAVLELRDAALGYDGRVLWSGLDLDVEPGEFVAVLGANGSGKTSLLRAVLGLQPLTSGTLRVGGRPARRGDRAIGYVPQQRRLEPTTPMRAKDVVRQGLDGHRWGIGRPGRVGWDQVARALEAVEATSYADVPVGVLSGGEQQRVRIAQALVADPSLLLCDEPLLSLDLASQRTVTTLVDRRRREHGSGVLFVTHEINPVLPYVDRVLYLAGGRFSVGTVEEVLTSGTLSDLYDAPIEVVRTGGRILVAGIPDTPDNAHHHEHHHDHRGQVQEAAHG